MPARQVFSAIVYVLRTGCRWKALPNEYGGASSVHAYFQRCSEAVSSSRYGVPGWPNPIGWRESPGGGKASMGQGAKLRWPKNVWDRTPPIGEKNGRKRSLLVDARGVPLSLAGSGANVHDSKLLGPAPGAIVCPRPAPGTESVERLCADAGYVGYPARVTSGKRNDRRNVKPRRQETEEERDHPAHPARRWVVERTHSWIARFGKLLVSFKKTEASYIALLSLAAALICWRQTIIIYG